MNHHLICMFFSVFIVNSWVTDAVAQSELPDGMRSITVTEEHDIVIANQFGINKVTGERRQSMISEELTGIQSVKAFKNTIYYLRNNALCKLSNRKEQVVASAEAIQKVAGSPLQLKAITFDANGNPSLLGCTDDGKGCILRGNPQGKFSVLIAQGAIAELNKPVAMTVAGETSVLVQCQGQDHCQIICLLQKKSIGTIPLGKVTSICYDHYGRLYGADTEQNRIMVQAYSNAPVHALPQSFKKLVAITYDPTKNCLHAIDDGINNWVTVPTGDPALPVDESPLPFTVAPAFPNIEWAGWEPVNDKGVPVPLRPIVLTHANDQSGRTFVATQHGVIHVFPNKPDVKKTKIFLDIQDRVTYKDTQNEEGFLGLAFHPKYKQNGEFFVYYTKKPGLLSVVSRFKLSKDDPDKADPNSEEVLLTLKQPMWNHNGGTVCFGHDGYLYIALGDGGGANDMFKNSRKMNTFHSKILRIDVDSKSAGKPYGIPADNPFVGKDGVLPEIYCYGIRNVWRLAFDRKTGQGWFGEVGQNLYEEINLLYKGADYGWNPRESFHPFGAASQAVNNKMIEPIWEYHHDVGKSITGGNVYRGKAYPELDGMYLYADYVSARIWALKYDFDQKRVVANREIKHRGLPIMSFGEDEDGETYLLTFSANGQGIDKIVRKK